MKKIAISAAQASLGRVWFIGFAVQLVFVVALITTGRLGSQTRTVADWFWASVGPTLTLILGALLYRQRHPADGHVDEPVFRIAWWLSFAYLLLVTGVLVAIPASKSLEPLETGKLVLQPLYGLLGLALGAFFVAQERETPVR